MHATPGRHATLTTLTTLTTLAALGVIFQALPVPCPFEPRRLRGEMRAVPCGARSDTWLRPASISQPLPFDIRYVRRYETGNRLYVEFKTVVVFSGT